MMMIAMIMMESIMMFDPEMTKILMITIMTMITNKVVCAVSLGNGYVRTSAFSLEHPHTELRAPSYPNASCALCRKPAIWHEFFSPTLRVSRYCDSRESEP
jgi:hypothetical protein